MKKRTLTILVAILCAFLLCFLFACGEKTPEQTEDPSSGGSGNGSTVHEHDWVRSATTPGTCITPSTTTYTCSICGQTRTEEGEYGSHAFENHVCRYDGFRQAGTREYEVGNIKFYLYEATRTISGDVTYLLVATGKGDMPDFTVTDTTDSRPWWARRERDNIVPLISEVEIDDGVTSVGNNFAKGCSRLRSIKIADSVKTIGKSAFENCDSTELNAFTGGNGITTVREYAFKNCRYLRRVTLGNLAKDVREGAFSGCTLLQTFSFGGGKEGTGAATFFGNIFDRKDGDATCEQIVTDESGVTWYFDCPNYLSTIEITGDGKLPDRYFEGLNKIRTVHVTGGVTEIGRKTFSKMPDLRSIDFAGNTLLTIGADAFADDNSLGKPAVDADSPEAATVDDPTLFQPQKISLPASLRTLGESAFIGCASVSTIQFEGNDLTTIPEQAFRGCSVLTKINIPQAVTRIGSMAFSGSGLKEIRITQNVSTIGPDAFRYCNVRTVYIDCENVYRAQYNDNVGRLFSSAQQIYVAEDVVGMTADAKKSEEIYIKQNYILKGLDESGYYLWEKE